MFSHSADRTQPRPSYQLQKWLHVIRVESRKGLILLHQGINCGVNSFISQLPDSQHLIFSITYKWAQYARGIAFSKPLQSSLMQHSSFLGPLVSYKENEVL